MMTVGQVSELAGVSIRALQHYDRIGLLVPSGRSVAGYRLYNEEDLERLQQILLYRELEFPLKEIATIVDSADFDRRRALEQQLELLKLKRERLDALIRLAEQLMEGEGDMGFDAFDTKKYDEYARRAKESWGQTSEWADYAQRSASRTKQEERAMGDELLSLFCPFGQMAAEGADPAGDEARAQAKLIQAYISEHFYACSDEVFLQLGRAYGAGGEFTQNINAVAGPGAAEFAGRAIEAWLG
ncbi:MAG: MerR family transcriptional regulator [Coriobacteriales bacterium]|nr:MerR family transcriptional regulator [Coriobacteriales bacterium]